MLGKLSTIIVLFVSSSFVLQELIGRFVGFMQDCVRCTMDKMEKSESLKQGNRYYKDLIEKEVHPFLLLREKREGLGFITRLIGWFEIVLFAGLLVLILQFPSNISSPVDVVKILGGAFAGWLAIKVVGSYGQWSGPVFGRATFYLFLIGSIANFVGAILIGFTIYWAILKIF